MDRWGKLRGSVGRVVDKIASSDVGYDKPKGVVAGFVSVSDFAENGEIIANLAYALSRHDVAVCVVDFKVFYPNLFDWFDGVCAHKKGDGLLRLLNSDKTEIKSVALETHTDNVFLISPSPNDDIEDYLNFSLGDVKRVVALLKESFDIVLIDIPNNPALEFCVGALMNCQRGFFVTAQRIDGPRNIQKFMEFMLKITDEALNFNNIILARKQDLPYDETSLSALEISRGEEKVKFKLAAKLPFLRAAQESALDGKIYLKNTALVNKAFAEGINKAAKIILEVT